MVTSSSADRSSNATTLVKQGLSFLSRGRCSDAVDAFSQAIAQDGQNATARFYRAQTHLQTKAYEAALEDFRIVLQTSPTHAKAWHGQGVAKAGLRLYPSAVDSFDQAIARDPSNDKIWYNRGQALLKLAQPHEALVSFNQAIEIRPDRHHTWYSKALAQAELEQISAAIDSLNKVVQLKDSCHYAWSYRGTLLNRLLEHQAALESFQQSLKHRRLNPNALYGIASSYALQNDVDTAALYLRQAIQINPHIYSLMARNDASFEAVRTCAQISSLLWG